MSDIAPGARTAAEGTEAEAARNVRSLFNEIAPTYDLLNHLLSFGLDLYWWRTTARSFAPILHRPEARVLDICCGTGDMTAALLKLRPTASEPVVGLDFSVQMLELARSKYPTNAVHWIEGDALRLPFPDESFDLVTAAWGFRNLTSYAAGLAEIHRVLRPGGRVGILECNQPDGVRGLAYNFYLHRVLPVVGGLISGKREAYRYLPLSIGRFPRPPAMLALMATARFTGAHWRGFLLHAAGLYQATKG